MSRGASFFAREQHQYAFQEALERDPRSSHLSQPHLGLLHALGATARPVQRPGFPTNYSLPFAMRPEARGRCAEWAHSRER
jgi:hypothetical protein